MMELMVSLGLVVLVSIAGLYLLRKFGSSMQSTRDRLEAIQAHDLVWKRLKEDFKSVQPWVNTTAGDDRFVWREQGQAFNSANRYDAFSFYREFYGEISARAVVEVVAGVGRVSVARTGDAQRDAFFDRGLERKTHYAVTTNVNGRLFRNLLMRDAAEPVNDADCPLTLPDPNGRGCFQFRISNLANLNAADLAGTADLRLMDLVTYTFTAGDEDRVSTLWRRVNNQDANRLEVVPQLQNLHVRYRFQPENPNRRAPNEPLRDILDPDYLNATPVLERVGWEDVASVIVTVSSGVPKLNPKDMPSGDARFQVRDGAVVLTSTFEFVPGTEMMTGFEGGRAIDPVCMDLSRARCNPLCVGTFTDPNQNSPRWVGWGQINSDRCLCGFDGNRYRDAPEGLVRWQDANAGMRDRLNACARFLDCGIENGSGTLDEVHPGCWLSRSCFQPTRDVFDRNASQGSPFKETLMKDLITRAAAGEVAARDRLQCRFGGTGPRCFELAQQFLGAASVTENVWRDTCECRIWNEFDDGNPVRSNAEVLRWDKLCRKGGTPGSFCPGTWNPGRNLYQLRSVANPQGLSPDTVALCECRERTFGANATVMENPRVNGLEFREPVAANPPLPGGQPNWNDAGICTANPNDNTQTCASRGSIGLPAVSFWDGFGVASGMNISCSAAQCNADPSSIGCCVTGRPNGLPPQAAFPAPVNGNGDLFNAIQQYTSYCNSGCPTGVGERDAIRRRIANFIANGTPNGNAPLPLWCGGQPPPGTPGAPVLGFP